MHARGGMPVDTADGPWGEVDDFVVDPTNWHLTHLVVQPHHHHERTHLVSVDSVESCDERITLTLSNDEIEETPQVETTEFVKIQRPDEFGNDWTTNASAVSGWPYYPTVGSATGLTGTGFMAGYSSAGPNTRRYAATTFDQVPSGRVEVRRSSHVISSDDHTVGTVDGFVFDERGTITHLVLDHGHLWGHRDITIPIAHVRQASAEQVRLDVTRDAIGEFPSVKFHRHARITE